MWKSSLLHPLVWLLWARIAEAAPSPKSPASLTKRDAPPQSTACGEIVRNANVNQFDASKVYECLTSVPFNPAVASRFIKYYKDSAQFQSTLAYLKNPPASYLQPAVDILGGLDVIQTRIDTGAYANQYEFEAALQRLIYSAHDDHFNLVSGILGEFAFGTRYRIVSVSDDGIALPQVYVNADMVQSQRDGGVWKPSPIITLDGEDATEYLTRFAAQNSIGGRESHTDWQQLMSSSAQSVQSLPSIWGGGATFYPGDKLVIGFKNGTTITTPWYGIFLGDSETGPLETGGDFYNSFVLGWWPASYDPKSSPAEDEDVAEEEEGAEEDGADDDGTEEEEAEETPAKSQSQVSATSTSTSNPAQTGWADISYPDPDIAQKDFGSYGTGTVSGYFLPGDIGVLSIPTFQVLGDEIDEFSGTVAKFIGAAHSRGTKKIVIDLQRNFGGDALLAYDTFKQFFPKIDPYGGSRLRVQPAANVMGKAISDYFQSLPKNDDDYTYLYANEWTASTRLNADTSQPFISWEEFSGPHASNGDSFSTTQRYNLEDPLFDTLALEAYTEGFIVSGYDKSIAEKPQLFAAEDIVILTDGVCGSTCSILVEMMHNEAGVKIVTAGGRPQYGPMQAVGLTRGVRSYGINTQLDSDITDTQILRKSNNQPADFMADRSTALEVEVTYATLNLRDHIRKGEEIPLQFQYDAADCRIFFTPTTVNNFTNLWKYAADAMWTKPELCVKDSSGHSNTDATDTKLPPKSLLPAPVTAETSSVNLAAVIMGIWNSNGASGGGIEANRIPDKQQANSNEPESTAPIVAPECAVDSNDEPSCSTYKNRYCDIRYAYCDVDTGKKIPMLGCVRLCKVIDAPCFINYGDEYKLGTCRKTAPDRKLTKKQLDFSWRGYCATDYRIGGQPCDRTVYAERTVTPDGYRPRVKREGDELFGL